MQEYPSESKIYENKRVILITGDASRWYEQAIFIVKKNISQRSLPSDLVKEAEGIIESYMQGVTYESSKNFKSSNVRVGAPIGRPLTPQISQKKKPSGFDFMLNFVMLICCVTIFAVLALQFL